MDVAWASFWEILWARNLVFFRVKWLHEGRDCDFAVNFLHFGATNFPIESLIQKPAKSCFFRLWRRDPVLEL